MSDVSRDSAGEYPVKVGQYYQTVLYVGSVDDPNLQITGRWVDEPTPIGFDRAAEAFASAAMESAGEPGGFRLSSGGGTVLTFEQHGRLVFQMTGPWINDYLDTEPELHELVVEFAKKLRGELDKIWTPEPADLVSNT